MEDSIEKFILQLVNHRVDSSVTTNMYDMSDPDNRGRAANLKVYLDYFAHNKPTVMLIGEAPGYNGCRLSGIPFTSNYVLNSSPFFNNLKVNHSPQGQKEPTASVVWNLLDEIEQYPLMWNIYPFHPHKTNNPGSNRKPTRNEIIEGSKYLEMLMDIFPDTKCIAVGKVAHQQLSAIDITCEYIRHPSYGGKQEFINGIKLSLEDIHD